MTAPNLKDIVLTKSIPNSQVLFGQPCFLPLLRCMYTIPIDDVRSTHINTWDRQYDQVESPANVHCAGSDYLDRIVVSGLYFWNITLATVSDTLSVRKPSINMIRYLRSLIYRHKYFGLSRKSLVCLIYGEITETDLLILWFLSTDKIWCWAYLGP